MIIDYAAINQGVLALAGVLCGSAATILLQVLANRTTRKQAHKAWLQDLRTERKKAVLRFLSKSHDVEVMADHRVRTNALPADAEVLTQEMWYLERALEIVMTAPVRERARAYAKRLNDLIYGDLVSAKDVWSLIGELRDPFVDAAQAELDSPTL